MNSINIITFLCRLDKNNINYCSWKNNHLIQEVLGCNKDLDLYVPLRQKSDFLKILCENNFIEGISSFSTFPYIHHYYALTDTGKIFHLHIYFRLLTGESHLKDYWLPIEGLLETKREKSQGLCLFVPDMETQRIIYILRHYLKKSSLMGLLMYWRERVDYDDELKKITKTNINNKTINFINKDFIKKLDSSLETSNVIKTWWLGIQLRFRIHGLKRLSTVGAFWKRYSNILLRIFNKFSYKHKKMLVGGGRFIAITGLDGSGKTSIIESVAKELAKDFTVKTIHIGRPPATLFTFPIRLVLTIRKKIKLSKKHSSVSVDPQKINLIVAIRYAVLAYERHILAVKAYKKATQGQIIFSDRYPSLDRGKMDSPFIKSNESSSKLVKLLERIEKHYYNAMPKPDLLLELYVPVAVAIKRNQERDKADKETDAEIIERYAHNAHLKYDVLNHLRVSNNQTFHKAKKKIIDIVWENLK